MKKTLYCLMLSSLGITTACVDNSYDLSKDIDMTVTVGGDLTTPANSSEEIKVGDLLDIDTENSDLKLDEDSNYVLIVNGDPENSKVTVNDVSVEGTSSTNSSSDLAFTTSMLQKEGSNISPEDETSVENIEELNPIWSLSSEDVTEDLLDIDYVDHIRNNIISLNLNFGGSAQGMILKKGLTFTFPSYMEIDLPEATKNDFGKPETLNNGKTRLRLLGDKELTKQGLTWQIYLKRINFKDKNIPSGEGFNSDNHSVKFDVSIPVEGTVAVKRKHFPAGSSEVRLNLESRVSSNAMTLERVRAKVDPKIDFNISSVRITDLPDFLTDNEVKVDLDNPRVLLEVLNNSEVDLNFSGELYPYKNGALQDNAIVRVGTPVNTRNSRTISLKGATNNLLCLSPKNEDIPAGYKWVQVDNLPDLIKNIPDSIQIENVQVQVRPDTFYTVTLGVDKSVRTDYNLNAPLKFGREFSIVYKDTLNGWNEDLDNYELKEVQVTLNAINSIPLNLEISAEAIDADGNVMPDVQVTTVGTILAPQNEEKKSEQKITFILKKDNGRIQNLDGLIIRLDGTACNTEQESSWVPRTLNAKQTLKLDELRLSIKGGVTLDLN